MRREPTIDMQGVKYQRALATQMPGASGLSRLKESNTKKGGAKLNAKTNTCLPDDRAVMRVQLMSIQYLYIASSTNYSHEHLTATEGEEKMHACRAAQMQLQSRAQF
jgi:hypothetical protein